MAASSKQLIHLNRAAGEITTGSNNRLTYKLNNPIELNQGDSISLYKAFLSERGLSPSTISFDKSKTFTLEFHYYIPANEQRRGTFDTIEWQEFQTVPDIPTFCSGTASPAMDQFHYYADTVGGPTNVPCIMYSVDQGIRSFNRGTIFPVIGKKTVDVPAGNYTVDALANIITEQFTAQATDPTNRQFADLYDLRRQLLGKFTDDFYDNDMVKEILYYDGSYTHGGSANDYFTESGNITGYVFLPLNTNDWVKARMESGTNTTLEDIEAENATRKSEGNTDILPYLYRKMINPSDNHPEAPTVTKTRYEGLPLIGAKNAELTYSGDTQNRFSFAKFHTPNRMQSHSADDVSNGSSGELITQFIMNTVYEVTGAAGYYPCDCSSGISILSFNQELIARYSTIYQNLDLTSVSDLAKLYYNRNEDWFDSSSQFGKTYYEQQSIWFRLGFTYDQLGNISQNVNTYEPYGQSPTNMTGLMTTNDYYLNQGIEGSGLGYGYKTGTGAPFQPFSTVNLLASGLHTSNFTLSHGVATIQSQPKYYSANQFPNLQDGKNYYVIHSDIVQNNYLDPKANDGAIVGIVSFSESALDTIFSEDSIQYPIVQDKLLTQINVRVSYPDGQDVPDSVLSSDSGLIFVHERAAQFPDNYAAEVKAASKK